jgi:hypothetical protein
VPELRWAQVIDVEVIRTVTEWLLPGLLCSCCGTVTFAEAPPGAHACLNKHLDCLGVVKNHDIRYHHKHPESWKRAFNYQVIVRTLEPIS